MSPETSRQIEEAAAAWAVRLDGAPLSAAEQDELESWQAADPRRRGALVRLRAVSLLTQRARVWTAGPDPLPRAAHAEPISHRYSRRGMMAMGGGAIAASGIAALGLNSVLRGASYGTKTGEVRIVSLEDGSIITLNTRSHVSVRFSREQRLIVLEEGDALFEVAKNSARPFIVIAGESRVQAVGTAFMVRNLPSNPFEVVVQEGVVDVSTPGMKVPLRMTADTRLVASDTNAQARMVNLTTSDVDRELAWRSGRLVFEGETLDRAAQSFSRYSEIRIVIDDPIVAGQEITGVFAANDPVSFAKAAALSLGLRTRIKENEVRLFR